jgi:hypothetical protein
MSELLEVEVLEVLDPSSLEIVQHCYPFFKFPSELYGLDDLDEGQEATDDLKN